MAKEQRDKHSREEFLRMAALSAGLVVLGGGCAARSGNLAARSDVRALKVASSLAEPVWVPEKKVLLAKVENQRRVAEVTPGANGARTRLSGTFAGMGDNLDLDPNSPDEFYVPQTGLDRVAVVSTDTLKRTSAIEGVPSPERISMHPGSKTIFVLSPDGRKLTPIDLYTSDITPGAGKPAVRETVEAMGGGPDATIQAPARNIDPTVWVVGSEGTAYYQGKPYPVEKEDGIPIVAGAIAVDMVKDTRAYVGPAGSDRLLRMELSPGSHKLRITAKMKTGGPVKYIAVDENRVYAATDSRLVALRADNFLGVRGFQVIKTIDFRRQLQRPSLKKAPLSGIATGNDTHEVYLTLKGAPYVLAITKPNDSL